jgi:hypothetical protein
MILSFIPVAGVAGMLVAGGECSPGVSSRLVLPYSDGRPSDPARSSTRWVVPSEGVLGPRLMTIWARRRDNRRCQIHSGMHQSCVRTDLAAIVYDLTAIDTRRGSTFIVELPGEAADDAVTTKRCNFAVVVG